MRRFRRMAAVFLEQVQSQAQVPDRSSRLFAYAGANR